MKYKLIMLILPVFCSQISAQITFEKVIDTLGSTTATCIRETLDGGYVFCGNSNFNGNDLQVIKLDSMANIQWAKVYTGPAIEFATEIEQLADSTYIVNGTYNAGNNCKSWLIALNTSGDSLWSQLFSAGPGSTNVDYNNSMAVINNSLVGLTGFYSPVPLTHTKGYFFSIIGNGIQLSSRIYDFSLFGTEPRAIATTSNSEYLITGGVGTSPSSTDMFLMRTTTFGDTLWYKTFNFSYQESGIDVIETSDNGILISGFIINPATSNSNICLIKTDAIGDTQWTKVFDHNNEQLVYSIQETQNGDFILTGKITGGIPVDGNVFLMKINSSGDSLWTKQFGGTSDDMGYSVQALSDGGYILSGYSGSFGTVGAYIIKTDSSGNIYTGHSELTQQNSQFSVFPNPAKNNLFIKSSSVLEENFLFEIFDFQRNLIYKNIFYGEFNSINIEDLSSSVYYCKLNYKSSVSFLKLVIID
ncbi:MAG: T9SS type A sorting domain-containing protein [Bacteroidia bacterium]|nr:T9SS type A sorting domain-containing protein [Bacteroidia bacterium]